MIQQVAEATGVSVGDILSSYGKRPVVIVRHAYWLLLWENTNLTIAQIARLNNTQNRSISYGVEVTKQALKCKVENVTDIWNLIKHIKQ